MSFILERPSFNSCFVRFNVCISAWHWLTRSWIRRLNLSSTALINDALICSSVIVPELEAALGYKWMELQMNLCDNNPNFLFFFSGNLHYSNCCIRARLPVDNHRFDSCKDIRQQRLVLAMDTVDNRHQCQNCLLVDTVGNYCLLLLLDMAYRDCHLLHPVAAWKL